MPASKDNSLEQLLSLVKTLDLQTISAIVMHEFRIEWAKVLYTIETAKLPMTPAIVARVICKLAVTTPPYKLEVMLARLRFIAIASQRRKWYVVRMLPILDPTVEKPPTITPLNLPYRIGNAIPDKTEVEVHQIEDMLYWSIRTFNSIGDTYLHGCNPVGESIALFSSLRSYSQVRGCVEALGYGGYAVEMIYGENLPYLVSVALNKVPAEQLSHNSGAGTKPVRKTKIKFKLLLSVIMEREEETLQDSDGME